MRGLAERAYFHVCLALGRLLRSAKYSTVRIVGLDDARRVRKRRAVFAPVLVRMSGPLMRILDTGVQVLPQREWEERERLIYWRLRGTTIQIEAGGTLVLSCLPGRTLASVLEDPALAPTVRATAIRLAVVALSEFHRLGFTHGDAMAENVLIDLEAGVANWFDFETVHDSSRPPDWRRSDDVRALLVTCLVRTPPEAFVEVVQIALDAYDDDDVTRMLAVAFTSVWRRPLMFHLAQAGLSFRHFREIARLLNTDEI